MHSIKKIIKEMLPLCVIDSYKTAKMIPRFLKAERMERKVGMQTISFYSDRETVDLIVEQGMSLSRYGDGEFRWMLEQPECSFQDCSAQLAQALTDSFQNKNPKLLIGIPMGMFNAAGCKFGTRVWWKIVKWENFSKLLMYIDEGRKYCNASITRPYIDYADRSFGKIGFENIRRIWDSKDCVFVEGKSTKLGVGNDLFDNANSIKRIICPAENAFERLEEIKAAIRTHAPKNSILLGALGPTASVLAAQMCDEGYQFVDIGHIDIEYMWYLNKAKRREPVAGKYVNECGRQILFCNNENEQYTKSILTVIQ